MNVRHLVVNATAIVEAGDGVDPTVAKLFDKLQSNAKQLAQCYRLAQESSRAYEFLTELVTTLDPLADCFDLEPFYTQRADISISTGMLATSLLPLSDATQVEQSVLIHLALELGSIERSLEKAGRKPTDIKALLLTLNALVRRASALVASARTRQLEDAAASCLELLWLLLHTQVSVSRSLIAICTFAPLSKPSTPADTTASDSTTTTEASPSYSATALAVAAKLLADVTSIRNNTAELQRSDPCVASIVGVALVWQAFASWKARTSMPDAQLIEHAFLLLGAPTSCCTSEQCMLTLQLQRGPFEALLVASELCNLLGYHTLRARALDLAISWAHADGNCHELASLASAAVQALYELGYSGTHCMALLSLATLESDGNVSTLQSARAALAHATHHLMASRPELSSKCLSDAAALLEGPDLIAAIQTTTEADNVLVHIEYYELLGDLYRTRSQLQRRSARGNLTNARADATKSMEHYNTAFKRLKHMGAETHALACRLLYRVLECSELLGLVYESCGDPTRAEQSYRRGLRGSEQLGSPALELLFQCRLALLHARTHDWPQADQCLGGTCTAEGSASHLAGPLQLLRQLARGVRFYTEADWSRALATLEPAVSQAEALATNECSSAPESLFARALELVAEPTTAPAAARGGARRTDASARAADVMPLAEVAALLHSYFSGAGLSAGSLPALRLDAAIDSSVAAALGSASSDADRQTRATLLYARANLCLAIADSLTEAASRPSSSRRPAKLLQPSEFTKRAHEILGQAFELVQAGEASNIARAIAVSLAMSDSVSTKRRSPLVGEPESAWRSSYCLTYAMGTAIRHSILAQLRESSASENPTSAMPADDDLASAMAKLSLGTSSNEASSAASNELPDHWRKALFDTFSFKAEQGQRHFQDTVAALPRHWTVCVLSASNDGKTLLVSRIVPGAEATPLVLRLPTTRNSADNSIPKVLGRLRALLEENRTTMKIEACEALTPSETSRWWTQRHEFDSRMRGIIELIEHEWLGAWSGVLAGQVQDERTELSTREYARELVDELADLWIKSKRPEAHEHPNAVAFASLLLQAVHDNEAVGAEQRLLAGLTDLANYIGNGRAIAASKSAKLDAIAKRIMQARANPLTSARHPTLLVLDKELQELPWESLPVLRGHAVCRSPSFELLAMRAWAHAQAADEESVHAARVLRRGARAASVSYVLNPSGDLTQTQQRLEQSFREQQGWSGIVGKVPQAADMIQALASHDVYLYV